MEQTWKEYTEQIANAIDGESFNSGGNIYLTLKTRTDGHVVVISEDAIAEYVSIDAIFDGAEPISIIYL